MELGNLIFGNSRGQYPVPREWQDVFCGRLNEMGFDSYGIPRDAGRPRYDPTVGAHLDKYERVINGGEGGVGRAYETDLFVIRPYYWGDDDTIAALPNYEYKPTGFKLYWYKYALRDSYMNQDVTLAQLDVMMRDCVRFIEEDAV